MNIPNMTQQAVLDAIYGAKTKVDVARASMLQRAWLRKHPGDMTVIGAGEQLEMMRTAIAALKPNST